MLPGGSSSGTLEEFVRNWSEQQFDVFAAEAGFELVHDGAATLFLVGGWVVEHVGVKVGVPLLAVHVLVEKFFTGHRYLYLRCSARRHLKQRPGGIVDEKLAVADVSGQHCVAGMAGLRPDFEH